MTLILAYAGSVITYTPTVYALDQTAVVTIIGSGFDITPVTGSIRSVRLELSPNCTSSSLAPNATSAFNSVMSTARNGTNLILPLNFTSLIGGMWSVCIDWAAAVPNPKFVRVGNTTQYLAVGFVLCHLIAFGHLTSLSAL